jgi:hypothetical protein
MVKAVKLVSPAVERAGWAWGFQQNLPFHLVAI